MRIPDSIVLRTSLLFALLTATVITTMGVVVRIAVDHHFKEMDAHQLTGKLELIREALSHIHDQSSDASAQDYLARALTGHADLQVVIQDPAGQPWFRFGNNDFQNPAQSHLSMHEKIPYRELEADTPQGYHIKLGLDISHHESFFAAFEQELLMIGACGLVTMALLGFFVTRRGLAPVEDMTGLVTGISGQKLDGRLTVSTLPIELRDLASAFNAMLDRLQDSLTRLSEFSSDIAHELRTPINNLMVQAQVSLSKSRQTEEYREVLYASLEEYERLANMIADMLFLAKADNGLITPTRALIDLGKEIHSLCEFYGVVAEEKFVQLMVQGNGVCQGDVLMLRRAIGNVLSNAIQYADTNTVISIGISSDAASTEISITNQGDTIQAEQLPRLFDRFYRTDASRKRNEEGAGLGLAITQSIIKAHGGHISIRSENSVTRFDIKIPTI